MFAAVLLGAIVGSSVNGLENLRDCERICSLAWHGPGGNRLSGRRDEPRWSIEGDPGHRHGYRFYRRRDYTKAEQNSVRFRGLTTAAGLWMTAAIGVAVGLGILGLAVIGTGHRAHPRS